MSVASNAAAAARPKVASLPLYVGIYCLLWSAAFVASKVAVTYCPPYMVLSIRFLLAGALILLIARVRGVQWNLSRRDIAVFAVLGICNNALYLGLSYFGLRTVSAGLASLIISTNPVLTAVLATMVLGETMTWRKVLGLVLGVAGVAFIVADRISLGTDGTAGVVFTLGALVSMVAGTILYKLLAPQGSLWIGNGVQNTAAGLVLIPFAAFADTGTITLNWQLALAFAFLVLAVSIFAYLIWFHLIDAFGATAASSFHFLMPPLGMLFGWLLLREHIALSDLLGIIPVAVGIWLVTRGDRARVAVSEETQI
jgi:drug/metabolite transporter (DMT)-like permease